MKRKGIVERIKSASSIKRVDTLLSEAKDYEQIDPKTARRAARASIARKAQLKEKQKNN